MSITNIFSKDSGLINPLEYQDYQFSIYTPVSKFVFNPFPSKQPSLIMPIDTLVHPRGILQLPFVQKKVNIKVALDWSTITLYEVVNDKSYQIPFTSSLSYFIYISIDNI